MEKIRKNLTPTPKTASNSDGSNDESDRGLLLSQSHINYYKFVFGSKFTKLRFEQNEYDNESGQRGRSFESTEPPSSATLRAGSSSEHQSSRHKSQSSTQSFLTTTSLSKNSTQNTNTKSSDKPSPSKENNKSRNKNDDYKDKPNAGAIPKKPRVNIHENPLASLIIRRDFSQRRKSSTTDTQKSSSAPLTSLISNEENVEIDHSTQCKLPKSRCHVSFESLSSVSNFSDTYVSTCDQFTFDDTSDKTKRRPYFQGITGVITPRLSYVLAHSTPKSSRKLLQKELHQTDRHAGSSVQREPNRSTVNKFGGPQCQKSAPAELDNSPPSPAPASPLGEKRKTFKQQDSKPSKYQQTPNLSRFFTSQDYQWWSNPKKSEKTNVTPGPRTVYLKIPDGTNNKASYEIIDSDPRTPKVSYRQSYLGVTSFDNNLFHSYLDPELKAYNLNQETSFTDNVHKQYQARGATKTSFVRGSSISMNVMDDHERKIIIEFCHLLEKSKQLFNGLRELPQYGHKQWSLYFGRTFDIYTRLWKYQQQHRAILDSKYGMKRWQIGEIASKIGQLYYHFYLRTSETAYLNEAFSFYYAIRGRCYYTKANKEDKCELMVKKLRYYARFIVVCLLLKKMKLVKELIKELDRQIIEYGNTYDPDDQVEWTVVVDEVKAFIHAEPVVAVIHPDNYPVTLSHRLTSLTTPPIERSVQMNLSLQEILIVGSSSQQVKFSELTMDMFRMLQTLEREPTGDLQHIFDESPRQRFIPTPSAQNQDGIEPGQKIPNPHKYLLFKPSPSQMLVYLASGCNDLPPNGALLLYISADGHVTQPSKHSEEVGYDLGGLITTSKNDIYRECSKDQKASASSKLKELQCLYPGDLYPFTRRPVFLIIDSDNSYAFQNIPRHFGQPLVILMSPLELPSSFHDRRQQGSLFTLFLHSPLSAFCYCCDISNISLVHWDRGQIYIDTFIAEASAVFVRSRIDFSYISFMGDDFLRLLLLRYVFCEVVLRMHRGFRARTHLTRCSPPLPDELFDHPTLVHIVMDLANHLQVRSHFHDPSINSGPPTTKD